MSFKLSTLLLGFVFTTTLWADRLPVDDVIDGMRFKAAHLEKLKNFLTSEDCAVTVNGNRVALSAGALRAEGLVMGVAPEIAGNYYAYDKAPKPEFLGSLMVSTDPRLIAAKFIYEPTALTADAPVSLQVKIAKPVSYNPVDPIWQYESSVIIMKLSDYNGAEGKSLSGETPYGDSFQLECSSRS